MGSKLSKNKIGLDKDKIKIDLTFLIEIYFQKKRR